MAILQVPGTGFAAEMGNTATPLVALFERDDTIAVPLLSQLRMAGYDVRAARTPVELFGMLGKQLVSLVLVDLGNATAGRREFWVALDAQRRGRSLQVMTFRFISPANALDPDFEPAARALADVEVRGIHEFQKVLDGVRQRIPLGGRPLGLPAPGAIPPIGAAFGIPSPFSQPQSSPYSQPSSPFSQPSYPPYASDPRAQASPFAQPLNGSPFAQPSVSNPFANGQVPAQTENSSPFAQPYNVNPFSTEPSAPVNAVGSMGTPVESDPFGQPSQSDPWAAQPSRHSHQERNGHYRQAREQHVMDAWIPPDEDDQVTSVVPEATFERMEREGRFGSANPLDNMGQMGHRGHMGNMGPALQEQTLHMAAPQQGNSFTATPTERALSTVLVEGAMLTEQKLEALRGIQQMLGNVGMQFKLGELALLFKFLSTDQLLAALLVSRGLVSPQQISSLGRIKQELAANGKDEDLATLLLKFQVLPADQLRHLQSEL